MALPTAETASNFNVVKDSKTTVGTTLENLKAAVTGETGANAKYTAYANAAEKAGFDQLARLWRATADAEQVHIELEYKLVQRDEPDWPRPVVDAPEIQELDLDLIDSAYGEMYETSDMYPSFVKKAQEEGDAQAVTVFSRAKLAEAYHAQNYIDAYNTIDNPDGAKYYLCPFCGYIHKGDDFENCPVCGAPKAKFKVY